MEILSGRGAVHEKTQLLVIGTWRHPSGNHNLCREPAEFISAANTSAVFVCVLQKERQKSTLLLSNE